MMTSGRRVQEVAIVFSPVNRRDSRSCIDHHAAIRIRSLRRSSCFLCFQVLKKKVCVDNSKQGQNSCKGYLGTVISMGLKQSGDDIFVVKWFNIIQIFAFLQPVSEGIPAVGCNKLHERSDIAEIKVPAAVKKKCPQANFSSRFLYRQSFQERLQKHQ